MKTKKPTDKQVEAYANKNELNIETHQNWKDAKQDLIKSKILAPAKDKNMKVDLKLLETQMSHLFTLLNDTSLFTEETEAIEGVLNMLGTLIDNLKEKEECTFYSDENK